MVNQTQALTRPVDQLGGYSHCRSSRVVRLPETWMSKTRLSRKCICCANDNIKRLVSVRRLERFLTIDSGDCIIETTGLPKTISLR